MRTPDDFDSSRTERTRLVTIAIVALLAGTLLGPGVAAAASSAWVRVKNWPAVQKVLVTNASTAPVYTQPPAHQIVNLTGGASISNANATSGMLYFYTVPAGKWLVISSMRAEGSGKSPIAWLSLSTYNGDAIHETFPINTVLDNTDYQLSANVSGPAYVPPGTALYLTLGRNTTGTGPWNATIWVDGYLTDRP